MGEVAQGFSPDKAHSLDQHTMSYYTEAPMNWLKVEVTVSSEASEALSETMLLISPSGVQISEVDGLTILTIYAPDTQSVEDVKSTIKTALDRIAAQGLEIEPALISVTPITDEDWIETYRKFFKPIKIGRLLVLPSWEDVEIKPGDIVIRLDPGLAFGTGNHPTTEGCLTFLEKYVSPGDIVFDLGTGSGILAIAAAKLGAIRVAAIDNDEEAINVAQENAALNGASDKIVFKVSDFIDLKPLEVDVLVANLTAPVIIELLPYIKHKLIGLRLFIASGIMDWQKDGVLEALEDNGFIFEEVLEKGEWVTIVSRLG